MEKTLFGKPLEHVEFTDVVAFCGKGFEESLYLDYKRDLSNPKTLAKTMASFANTVGGWLIIGVEDDDGKPKKPFKGIPYSSQLALTITNIIVDRIWPYFRPIVHVCSPGVGNKTFVIIYIPESAEAPHWTDSKSRLYIRRGQRSSSGDWERYATAEEWEWLRNKREKALEQREYAKDTLDQIYLNLRDVAFPPNYLVGALPSGDYKKTDRKLNVFISPYFPQRKLFNGIQAYNAMQESSINTSGGGTFPTYISSRTTFDEGAYTYGVDDDKEAFVGLDNYGALAVKREVVRTSSHGEGGERNYITFHEVISRLEDSLEFAGNIYRKSGFLGLLQCEVEIHGESNMRVIFRGARGQSLNRDERRNIRGSYYFSRQLDNTDVLVKSKRYSLMREIATSLIHSFGFTEFDQGVIDEAFERLVKK